MTQQMELSPAILDPLRYITQRINRIEARVSGLAQQSGGAYTSIETGDGSMDLFDDDGNLLSTVGVDTGFQQLSTIYGAPTPEDPDVTPAFNALVVAYDGTFTDGDWEENNVSHVEIHATANNTDTLDDQNQIGTFTSSNGGVFTYTWNALDGGRWIWLQAVTTAGEEGTPSNPVFAVPDAIGGSDGSAPATAPTVTVEGAIQAVVARWDAVDNADPTFYRVFAKAGSAPSVVGTTDLFIDTPSTSVLIDHLPGGGAIAAGTTVHVRVIPYDVDGDGPASTDASDSPIQIGTGDVLNNAITSPLIGDNQIVTAKIAPDAVTAAQIAAGAVDSAELAANAVTTAKILDGAISTLKVANNAITAAQVANDTLTDAQIAANAITATEIAANAVTNAKILDGAVSTLKVANLAITAAQVANDTLTATQIANAAITANEIAADAVTNTKILDGAVSTLKVANTAITAAQIALLTITAGQIANDTLTATQIATNAITATEIATDAVTTPKLIAGAVTAAKITADTITANEIAASAITTSELAALSVTAGKIVADTITANEIAANAITTSELAALSVNASKIVANTITAAQIAATTITANEIVALTITGAQIAATTITGGKMVADTVTANEIAANAITTSELNALAVTAAKIAANTITAGQIAAGTITATEILASTITGAKIAATTITASNIVADTITANEIAANAITTSELNALAVTAAKIAANTITASQIAALTITGNEIAANTITAGKIVAGTITSNEIAANTITANKLLITVGGGNMIGNSSFFDTSSLPVAFGTATRAAETGTTYRYGRGLKITSTSASNPFGIGATIVQSESITVKLQPNTAYVLSAWIYNPSAGGVTSVSAVIPVGQTGIASTGTVVSSTVTNQWVRVGQTFVTGASGNWAFNVISNANPANGSIFYIGAVQVEPGDVPTAWSPKADEILPGTIVASMIVADTITANEIAANAITTTELNALSVTAGKIVANTITAGQIAANTITAAQITAGTITATEIAANTITAAKIAAGTITATEIAANTITTSQLSATAINGMTITGATFQTTATGNRIVLRNDGTLGIIEMFTGIVGETKGFINPTSQGSTQYYIDFQTPRAAGETSGRMQLLSSQAVGSLPATLSLLSTKLAVGGDTDLQGVVDLSFAGLRVTTGTNFTGRIGMTATGTAVVFKSGSVIVGNNTFNATNPTAANTATLHAADVHSWTGGVTMEDLTGGGSTTATINNSGRIIRTTSSKRYKYDIKALPLDEARKALLLEPVTFKLKDEKGAKRQPTYGGFIAEQAHEAGLRPWINYNNKRQPDGFRYGEFTAALLAIVKDHDVSIRELKAQVAALV